ncbi:hypothetical protein H0E82_14670 [Luteimonas sp. SJ-16]|uniref:Alanine dehydrogenase/pyridine nucleotide transhydrogenase NAD(H)-binding domain-containing protein n=1 Tax=Luteimonas deserti TaxID=2752306 RepID=A0A7Z0QVR7_9GAMM|nr:hypothetical protein [Luteimonas deserti]
MAISSRGVMQCGANRCPVGNMRAPTWTSARAPRSGRERSALVQARAPMDRVSAVQRRAVGLHAMTTTAGAAARQATSRRGWPCRSARAAWIPMSYAASKSTGWIVCDSHASSSARCRLSPRHGRIRLEIQWPGYGPVRHHRCPAASGDERQRTRIDSAHRRLPRGPQPRCVASSARPACDRAAVVSILASMPRARAVMGAPRAMKSALHSTCPADHLEGVDAICTAAVPGRRAPSLLTCSMVAGMRPLSVIVDRAAETGGNPRKHCARQHDPARVASRRGRGGGVHTA